jgi:transglutaminase/protease-like cytokinesis protein 3
MSNYDKARAIHDYLVRTVHYRSNRDDQQKYDAYGALINHYAVCAGYAKAFELMCACCEIKCHLVEGETKDGSSDGHAWNIAKIGGKWRHVDVTWDDPVPESNQDGISHTYFNVTDRFISKDHTWDRRDYPKCR